MSRAVTAQAYEQLVAEGWLEGRHGSGTYVAPVDHHAHRSRPRRPAPAPGRPLVRLDAGTPWIDPRYAAAWRRAWRDVSTATPRAATRTSRPARAPGRARRPARPHARAGVRRRRDRRDLRDRRRAAPGAERARPARSRSRTWLPAAAETVLAAGRGLRDLPALEPVTDLSGVVAAYVTRAPAPPRTGHVGGPHSARGGRAADAVVFEDDYDSEFRYDVAPVPALATLDRDRVAYLGTASKSVAPSMRLGWLVPPPQPTGSTGCGR